MEGQLIQRLLAPIFLLLFIAGGCQSSANKPAETPAISLPPGDPIAQYVVDIFEDRHGTLWFGTIDKGLARYDGDSLHYFTMDDGLPDNTVVSIAEDANGLLWLGTHNGLSNYNGETFTNFTTDDGLSHFRVSHVFIDSKNQLWVGSWGGVSRLQEGAFVDFPLPIPDIELKSYQTTMDWISAISEDRSGNIWIGQTLEIYGLAKCWNIWTGQMLEIYGMAPNPYLIKRGACPPFNYILFWANPYISNIWPSMCFQHLAKHVFPAFAQACVLVFGPSMCFNFWPKHVFKFLAQACVLLFGPSMYLGPKF